MNTRTSSKHRRAGRVSKLVVLVVVLCSASLVIGTPAYAATRDIVVHLTNSSDSALTRDSLVLAGGCWDTEPPLTIAIGESVTFHSESCGVATGTEFGVVYKLDANNATMVMHYSNPFGGSDTFDENAPPGYGFSSGGVIEDRSTTFGCDSKTCDGIPDDWKKNGVTIDPGGGNPPQFVDLPKMGVSLDRPNILVQLDWMQDATHNQQLGQAAIDTVVNAYDQDPVTYPGATRSGITFIVDAGPNSTIAPGGATWGSLSRAQQIPWTQDLLTGSRAAGYQFQNFYTLLKSNFVPTGRLPIFHYSVAAAELAATGPSPNCYKGDSTSGVTPGDKLGFIVSLGDWTSCVGNQGEQSGTFMHELGHALGLDHGGADGVNYKSNYPSIMNYAWQTIGVLRGGTRVFDYSRDTEPDVDETTLTESGGVSLGANPSNYGTTYSCTGKDAAGNPVQTVFTQAALSPVDWSCDGKTPNGGTGFDANTDGSQGVQKGATSDWSRIRFKTGGVGAGSNAKDTVTIPSSGISSPSNELTFEQSRLIRSLPLTTNLTYDGPARGDYHDLATVSATLRVPGDGLAPPDGKTITIRIGASSTDVCSGVTNSSGTATCTIRPTQVPAAYVVTASFAGDTIYKAASDSSQTFTIRREETLLTFNGPTVLLAGSTTTKLSAQLQEIRNDSGGGGGAFAPDPFGQTVTFTLGAQSCSGVTDHFGVAGCSIPNVSGAALGPKALNASFAGDTYYLPSADSDSVIVFAFPSSGAFVLGDTTVATATPNTSITWWGAGWSGQNRISGGAASSSFKGFASDVTTLPTTSPASACGTRFVSRPGNSASPPSAVPSYMGVVVASSVTKSGSNVNGVWGRIVVVKTSPGYAANPGHAGTGTIVATFCP